MGYASGGSILMTTQSIGSYEDQKVTFGELFFDLVFLFSVTQVLGRFRAVLALHSHWEWHWAV